MGDHSLSSTHATEDLRSRAVSLALHLRGRVNRSPVIKIPGSHDVIRCLDVWIIGSTFPDGFKIFQDISSLSSTPLTKITTLYSFGTRGKPTCQHSFLEIQPAEVHDACDALHALCLWHLPGSPECLANALRMPCDCSKPDLPKFFL